MLFNAGNAIPKIRHFEKYVLQNYSNHIGGRCDKHLARKRKTKIKKRCIYLLNYANPSEKYIFWNFGIACDVDCHVCHCIVMKSSVAVLPISRWSMWITPCERQKTMPITFHSSHKVHRVKSTISWVSWSLLRLLSGASISVSIIHAGYGSRSHLRSAVCQ